MRGTDNQTFFFLQKGFVKIGSITEGGHELIYDVRKAGDIVGELCASGQQRQDRAVALERHRDHRGAFYEVLEIVQSEQTSFAGTGADVLRVLVRRIRSTEYIGF